MRIHTAKTSGVIFRLLLKQQKTKASSGRSSSARVGVASAMTRRRSFGW